MDYEKIFLDWKTRRTFENEMPESSAYSKNDTTKCAGMSDTSERNGSKLSTLCELTIEAGELEKALLDKVYGQEHAVSTFVTGYFQAKLLSMTDPSRRKPAASFCLSVHRVSAKLFWRRQWRKHCNVLLPDLI